MVLENTLSDNNKLTEPTLTDLKAELNPASQLSNYQDPNPAEGYTPLKAVIQQYQALNITTVQSLTRDLPRQHVDRTKNQLDQVCQLSDDILAEVSNLNEGISRLRQTLQSQLYCQERKTGLLVQAVQRYELCVPYIDEIQLRNILEEDKNVWKDYYEQAVEVAEREVSEVTKLIEQQKQQLEALLSMSQQRLDMIPAMVQSETPSV